MNLRTRSGIVEAAFTLAIFTFSLAVSAQAQTESVIYSFTGRADGWGPSGGLISDEAGNLYGTTVSGGDLSACQGTGCGVLYKLAPSDRGWVETVPYTFTGGADGASPAFGLVSDANGNLYGVATAGGNSGCLGNYGCGVVFQLSPTASGWKETVLYAFTGGNDGSAPYEQLVMDGAGNIYGTTAEGGNLIDCASHPLGCGVAFKLSRAQTGWIFTLLYNFTDSDSSLAASALILDAAGDLYGTGEAGAHGVVYELSPTPSGPWKDTVLYTFSTGAKGSGPTGLIFDARGNLYGPTFEGGTGGPVYTCQDIRPGCGTLFKLSHGSRGWIETVLHDFTGEDPQPNGSLIFDAVGDLYGVDSVDAFKLSRGSSGGWKITVLHKFAAAGDGLYPRGPLLLDKAGNLFGVTYGGGFGGGYGAVFEITP